MSSWSFSLRRARTWSLRCCTVARRAFTWSINVARSRSAVLALRVVWLAAVNTSTPKTASVTSIAPVASHELRRPGRFRAILA